MRAMIFEQWQGGHYFNYLEVLVPALAAISTEVVVAVTRQAASSALFNEQLDDLRLIPNVCIYDQVPLPSVSNPLAFRSALAANVLDAVEQHKPDFLLLPSGDEQLLMLPILDLLRGRTLKNVHVEVLLHYPAFTRSANWRARAVSLVQRMMASSRTFDRVGFVSFVQHDAVSRLADRWTTRTYVAGDPVEVPLPLERSHARKLLGINETGMYVGMIGELDARKAVPEALAAFRLACTSCGLRMLLAGRLHRDYARMISTDYSDLVAAGRLIMLDRYLTTNELRACFAALDVQCAVYRSFEGLSSLLLKGLAGGTRTIASAQGWPGELVRRFGLGWTVMPGDTQSFAHTLVLSAANPVPASPEAVARLLAFHSAENFCANVLERAVQLAGLPAVSPLRWSNVGR